MIILKFHTDIPVTGSPGVGFTIDLTIVDESEGATDRRVVGRGRLSVVPSERALDGDLDGVTNLSVRANALWIEELVLDPDHQTLADSVVTRILETVGQTCAFATVEVASSSEAETWADRGFLTPPDAPAGPRLMYLDLAIRN